MKNIKKFLFKMVRVMLATFTIVVILSLLTILFICSLVGIVTWSTEPFLWVLEFVPKINNEVWRGIGIFYLAISVPMYKLEGMNDD